MASPLGPIATDYRRRKPALDGADLPDVVEIEEELLGSTALSPFQIEPANDGTGDDIVTIGAAKPEAAEGEFYANLAETIDETVAADLVVSLLKKIEGDRDARKKRDEQYEEGLRRTGLGDDAPGGGAFEGASKVVHPVMTEAGIDFMAAEMRELMPPDGPVKAKIVGVVDPETEARAERKAKHMNLQITQEIEEYRAELEEMLSQVPFGGSQYFKVFYDEDLGRASVEFVPIDDVYLPFSTTYFYTAQRITHVQHLTEEECAERVESGMYLDFDYEGMAQLPEQTRAQQANDGIEGKTPPEENEDGLRDVYECSTYWRFDGADDPKSDGKRCPYLITIDKETKKLLAIYRNWEESDRRRKRIDTLIEFKFIPWRGAYGLGLPQLIGMLSGAATGALRALLDSALTVTIPTLVKARGRPGGASDTIQATQVSEVDVPAGKTLRESMQQISFPGPSPVLYQLLEFLIAAAKGVVTTAEEKIADASNQMPVGTAMALIEQGSKVVSSIHGRMHDAHGRVLKAIHRINRLYLDDEGVVQLYGEPIACKADYQFPVDVIPVSDPLIFSETQRVAQAQLVASRADAKPELYEAAAVESMVLKRFRIPDADRLLKPHYEATNTDSVSENVAISLGRPVEAFPEQDHLAHLVVHLTYFTDPRFGASPLVAPVAIQGVIGHVREHLVYWYQSLAQKLVGDEVDAGSDDSRRSVEEMQALDHAYAMSSAVIAGMKPEETPAEIAKLLPSLMAVMQAAQAGMQAMQPLMEAAQPKDQMAEAAKAETARKTDADKLKGQTDQGRLQVEGKRVETAAAREAREAKEAADRLALDAADLERQKAKDATDAEQRDAEIEQKADAADLAAETKVATNNADNETALIITGMDAESEKDKASGVTTGTGINPGP